MDNELKQAYTRRLSQCNQGEMIVIIYDIFFTYSQEAKGALQEKDREKFKKSIQKAQNVLDELMGALDFSYDVSKSLIQLYRYCKTELAKSVYEFKPQRIEEAESVMKSLHSAFLVAAEQDKSMPLMSNTQQVYAGITYGKTNINESCYLDNHRGFFA